jgi:hypothetical protein
VRLLNISKIKIKDRINVDKNNLPHPIFFHYPKSNEFPQFASPNFFPKKHKFNYTFDTIIFLKMTFSSSILKTFFSTTILLIFFSIFVTNYTFIIKLK